MPIDDTANLVPEEDPEKIGAQQELLAPSGPVRTFTVNLTTRCNLECSYCYRTRGPARTVDWSTLRRGLDWARDGRGGELTVVFTGGEPLLEFPLLEHAVRYLVRRPGRRPTRIRLGTNGTLLDRARLDFLSSFGVDVHLSLDGIEPAQTDRGTGTWDVLDQTLRMAQRLHPTWFDRHLAVAMTVTPANIFWLADSVDYLLELGVQEIRAHPVLTRTADRDIDRTSVLADQVARVHSRSLRHFRTCGTVPFFPLRPAGDRSDESCRNGYCPAMTGRELVLDVDGRVTSCALFAGSGIKADAGSLAAVARELDMGHVTAPGLEERRRCLPLRVPEPALFSAWPRKGPPGTDCTTCPAAATCHPCPFTVLESGEDAAAYRIDPFTCAWYRAIDDHRRRFLSRGPHRFGRAAAHFLQGPLSWWRARNGKSPAAETAGDPPVE